jgi:hypothetical protein
LAHTHIVLFLARWLTHFCAPWHSAMASPFPFRCRKNQSLSFGKRWS